MSWLLVALIPGLLMLVTLGLERVEAGLRNHAMSPADVDDIVEEASEKARAAEADHSAARRRSERETLALRFVEPTPPDGLPAREYLHELANTEFRQTRYANPV